jgi:hypothetical protein
LPSAITQQLLNDPVTLLQQTVQDQLAQGYSFSGVALNISTATEITFFDAPVINGSPLPTATPVTLVQAGGDIGNINFLLGPSLSSGPPNNAFTALFYATFWLEKLTHPTQPTLMQLQYAQMTMLNFPALLLGRPTANPPVPPPNFAWPHVQVATLQKTFG